MNKIFCITFIIAIEIMYFSCKTDKKKYFYTKDADLQIEVSFVNSDISQKGTVTLNVRILPSVKSIEHQNFNSKVPFYYAMDSVFYIAQKNELIRTNLVEPVANGVKTSFEYVIYFESNKLHKDSLLFIYKDKLINKKKYEIRLY